MQQGIVLGISLVGGSVSLYFLLSGMILIALLMVLAVIFVDAAIEHKGVK